MLSKAFASCINQIEICNCQVVWQPVLRGKGVVTVEITSKITWILKIRTVIREKNRILTEGSWDTSNLLQFFFPFLLPKYIYRHICYQEVLGSISILNHVLHILSSLINLTGYYQKPTMILQLSKLHWKSQLKDSHTILSRILNQLVKQTTQRGNSPPTDIFSISSGRNSTMLDTYAIWIT